MPRPSRWGNQARTVILGVIAECRALDLPEAEVLRRVDAAYPFGERKYWPYKAWLSARRELLELPGSVSRADSAKLRAWEGGVPIIDPGGPLTPLEAFIESLDEGAINVTD
jgi:hypothetical protein